MLKVDCHFHPNLFLKSKFLARRKALRIWRTFEKHQLDAVFVSEHAYKHPARSYRLLRQYKPREAKTFLIPAVEAITSDCVDVIVFSRDAYVYQQEDILQPFNLSLSQLVNRIENDSKLYGFIVHPHMFSKTSFRRHFSEEALRYYSKRLGFLEKHNSCLHQLYRLFKMLRLDRLFKKINKHFRSIESVPFKDFDKSVLPLGGSDAHKICEIGDCLVIGATNCATYKKCFHAILNPNHERSFEYKYRSPLSFFAILLNAWTVFHETTVRRRLGLKESLTRRYANYLGWQNRSSTLSFSKKSLSYVLLLICSIVFLLKRRYF